MIGTTIRGTSLFLAAVAAQVEDCEVRPGEPQGAYDWICIPTPHGHVEVFDAEEVGEHGLVIRTYTLDDGHPTGHGRGGWISERATVEEAVQAIRRYVRETSDEGPRLVSLGPQDARPTLTGSGTLDPLDGWTRSLAATRSRTSASVTARTAGPMLSSACCWAN